MDALSDQFVARATDDTFVKMLSNVLVRIVSENESKQGIVTRFNSMVAPPISVSDYVARIARHVRCSNECFVLALVYIERITRMHDNFVVSILNVHRLVITAVMLAAKFSDDVYYSNKFYAQVGGVSVSEINLLEAQFLRMLNFQLYVSTIEYESYRMGVEKANLFGAMPTGFWRIAWNNAASHAAMAGRIPNDVAVQAGMTMAQYSATQPSGIGCSTRYLEGISDVDPCSVPRVGHYKALPYARPYEQGSNPGMPYCQPNQETARLCLPIDPVPRYPPPVGDFSRQPTGAAAGYHVLSNVHMPQMPTAPRNDTTHIGTPSGHHLAMGTDMTGGYGRHYHMPMFPSAASCCKHYAGGEPVPRRSSRPMLNRMCTQHLDSSGLPHVQWAVAHFTPSMHRGSRFGGVGAAEGEEGCASYMSALEARHRESLKGKCVPRAETWSYEDNRQLCRSRNMMAYSKIKEAA
ncbi:cyclin2 related protein [Babesia caballi]|uniref:Cyclin2 related protein n=1 Tax=Babesia caballi TaxID=5871 RepID=A0AAV4LWX4_BABCB|nr:cyclin2 related protein [Babesia caballi]